MFRKKSKKLQFFLKIKKYFSEILYNLAKNINSNILKNHGNNSTSYLRNFGHNSWNPYSSVAQNLEIGCWNLFDPFGCFAVSWFMIRNSQKSITSSTIKSFKRCSNLLA